MPSGETVSVVRLSNDNRTCVEIINRGATLRSFRYADGRGRCRDLVLGFDDMAGYLADTDYVGATIGRFANRLSRGRFQLAGAEYQLSANERGNMLHGGDCGFNRRLWEILDLRAEGDASVTLGLISPDGDQGFPGELSIAATFTLDATDGLTVDYRATTTRTTIVSLTNHAYWNLGGAASGRSIEDHWLTIPAGAFIVMDASGIPTGERRGVHDTAFDFRSPKRIGARIDEADEPQLAGPGGYDRSYVLAATPGLRKMADLTQPESGVGLSLWSNQPVLQLYTGNHLCSTVPGKGGRVHRPRDGVALEPQAFPDAPNHPDFGTARLDPGQIYRNVIRYVPRRLAE